MISVTDTTTFDDVIRSKEFRLLLRLEQDLNDLMDSYFHVPVVGTLEGQTVNRKDVYKRALSTLLQYGARCGWEEES